MIDSLSLVKFPLHFKEVFGEALSSQFVCKPKVVFVFSLVQQSRHTMDPWEFTGRNVRFKYSLSYFKFELNRTCISFLWKLFYSDLLT